MQGQLNSPVAAHRPFPRGALEHSIPHRFARIVADDPTRLAVSTDDARLSYGDLDEISGSVAAAIVSALGDRDEPVALLIEQGAMLIAAMLGALRAGKAYVPLDHGLSDERLAALLEECGPRLVVAGAAYEARARRITGTRVLSLAAVAPARAPVLDLGPDRLAYVYYTSGSTGHPKGVMDTHRNVLHNILRYTNGLQISAADRLTLLQGPAFSGAVSNVFSALLNGASVHPYDVGSRGLGGIGPWLAAEQLTIYHSVPSIFRHAFGEPRELPRLRLIRLEGDRAAPRDVDLFRRRASRSCRLVNGLGATECGIVRQLFLGVDDMLEGAVVPIGYPVPDMDIVLVDESGGPVPDGEPGEIVVRSRYLSPGYWRQPGLTAQAFADDPRESGVRRYRTGDVGRLGPDGCLEHLGRTDHQLKVRGQRVEVELVEERLRASGLVEAVALATRPRPDDEVSLVAYVVPRAGTRPTVTELRETLIPVIPAHSIPTDFVSLDQLPLGPNGKVDMRALPDPGRARPLLSTPYVAPRSEAESEVVQLWQELLDREPIGIDDDFAELGGDSLAAAAMVARLAGRSGRNLPLDVLVRAPTAALLSRELATLGADPMARAGVLLNDGGSSMPLVLLHGDYVGGAVYARLLARALGPDQPLVVLGPHRPGSGGQPRTIEAMALAQHDALRELQPTGPYLIAGLAHAGGFVAYELARVLRGRGERVAALILIGTLPPHPGARLVRRAARTIATITRLPPDRADDLFVELRQLAATAGRSIGLLGRWQAAAAPDEGSDDGWTRTINAYAPAPLGVELTLLWPREEPAPERGPAARWSRLARSVATVEIGGTYRTAVTEHLDELASALAETLRSATPGRAGSGTGA